MVKISKSHLFFSILLIIASWWTWLSPTTSPYIERLDRIIFLSLNSTLLTKNSWTYFWMLMNHPYENWINIVLMLFMQILIICCAPKQQRSPLIYAFIFYWVLIQVGVYMQHAIYHQWLGIERLSPSLIIPTSNRLSILYDNPAIKDESYSSFPGGHGFAAVLWAIFTCYFATKKFWPWILLITLILCSGRIISGAHWFTDIFYSGISAYFLFSLALATPIFRYGIKSLEVVKKIFLLLRRQ